jgi:hypothetical protein
MSTKNEKERAAFMSSRKSFSKPNGHAGAQSRPNGHAPASTERGGIPERRDQAASDDGSRASVTGAAGFGTAPGTDCQTYADPAPSPPNGHSPQLADKPADQKDPRKPIPGGEFPLPADPGEFVDEIHRRADLFEVWQKLLNHEDPKIQQRAVEKLTEMRYKGVAALADEPEQIVIDIDSAVARRAAQGAKK